MESGEEVRSIQDPEVLKAYFKEELKIHEAYGSVQDNEPYLHYIPEFFVLTTTYGYYVEQSIVAIIVIPDYDKEVCMRLYVSPTYRNSGIGTYLLNHFNIKRLSVLRDNLNALRLYNKRGFKVTQVTPFLIGMQRNLPEI